MNCCVHAGMNHLLLKQIAISLGRNCHIHLWQVIYASGVMQFGALLKGKEEEKKNQLWHPLAGTTVRYSSMHGSHGNSAIGKNFSFEGETEVRRWQAFREGWRCHKALTWESGSNFTFSIYFFYHLWGTWYNDSWLEWPFWQADILAISFILKCLTHHIRDLLNLPGPCVRAVAPLWALMFSLI